MMRGFRETITRHVDVLGDFDFASPTCEILARLEVVMSSVDEVLYICLVSPLRARFLAHLAKL